MSEEAERWELPEGWVWRRIREVCTQGETTDPSMEPKRKFNYLDIGGIDNNRGRIAETKTVAGQEAPSRARRAVRPNDVVFANVRPYLKNIAIITELDAVDVCSTGFTVLRAGPSISPHYLLWWVHSRQFIRALLPDQTGTLYPAVSDSDVTRQWIPVAPIETQQRLLATLEPMLDRVAKERGRLEGVLRDAARTKRSVLAAAFRGELTAGWRKEQEAADESQREAPDETLPNIPATWTWDSINGVAASGAPVSYGIVLPGPEVQAGVPYVRQADIEDGWVRTDDLRHTTREIADQHARSSLREGDVLLCIIRHLRVAIVPRALEGANITQGSVRIRVSDRVCNQFVFRWLTSPYAQDWMRERYTGTDMPRINVETARAIPVPLPPLDEQREIVRVVDRWFATLDDVEKRVDAALKQCDRLRESLLQKAFRGELMSPPPTGVATWLGDVHPEPAQAPLQTPERPIIMAAPREGAGMSKKRNDREHQFGGPWTETKLGILRGYLTAYNTALSRQDFERVYVDAFAGTGYRTQRSGAANALSLPDLATDDAQGLLDGSAVYALKTEPPFHRYVFVDKSAKRCDALEGLRAQFPERAGAIDVRRAEANDAIRALCAEPWSNRRAVLFLDPYGMQVEWKTIEAVARTRAIDLWLLFPLGIGVGRLLTRSGEIPEDWRRRLDLLLGTEDWFDAFYRVEPAPTLFDREATQVARASVEVIGRYFVDRLKTVFAGVAEPRVLRNSTQCPMYLLCFAAANPKGAPIALRIAKHLLEKVD